MFPTNSSSPRFKTPLFIKLEMEDMTLKDILDEDDLLQECHLQNKQLVNFIIDRQNLHDLIGYIMQDCDPEIDDTSRHKYCKMCLEIVSAGVPEILNNISEDGTVLQRLYLFLQSKYADDPLICSFYSKLMGLLIAQRYSEILYFFKTQTNFVGSLLHRIGCSAIMDLILRLITFVESTDANAHRECIEWLAGEKLIQQLVDMISISCTDELKQSNASQLLCDIIRLSRENLLSSNNGEKMNLLMCQIESKESITYLLENMFAEPINDCVLIHGMQVIHQLLENKQIFAEVLPDCSAPEVEEPGYETYSSNLVEAILPFVPAFHKLLLICPTEKMKLMTTAGELDPPLGLTRIYVVKVFWHLIALNKLKINTRLAELGTLSVIMDLFAQYQWNSFLHVQVETCLRNVLFSTAHPTSDLEGYPLLLDLFGTCNLVQRILDMWHKNEASVEACGARLGYMGHLIQIANLVHNVSAENEPSAHPASKLIADMPKELKEKWLSFTENELAVVNRIQAADIPDGMFCAQNMAILGASPNTSNDKIAVLDTFHKDIQQAFNDYHSQQMTKTFVDHFGVGINEEEFGEMEDFVNFVPSRPPVLMCLAPDESNRIALCNQVADQRICAFSEVDDEDRAECDLLFTSSKNSSSLNHESTRGSSDEEDRDRSTTGISESEGQQTPEELPQQMCLLNREQQDLCQTSNE